EDWSGPPEAKTGIPAGWKGQTWGSPKYDFTVMIEGTGKVLHLRSENDNSTISKEVRIDVRRFPSLVWRWKVVSLPAGGDARRRATDDQAGQIYVTFPRFPPARRSRIMATSGIRWRPSAPSPRANRAAPPSLTWSYARAQRISDAGSSKAETCTRTIDRLTVRARARR